MKRLLPLLIVSAFVLASPAGFAQETPAHVLSQAQDALQKGDIDTAKERFEFVLKIDPENRIATNFLRMIAAQESSQHKTGVLEKQLQGLILPQVELKDATLDTALDYMRQLADKTSGGKIKVSFVVQVPEEETAAKKVTISLRNIPYTEVLHYLAELTGYKFTVEQYAITVKPNAAPAPVQSSAPVSSNDTTTTTNPGDTTRPLVK